MSEGELRREWGGDDISSNPALRAYVSRVAPNSPTLTIGICPNHANLA